MFLTEPPLRNVLASLVFPQWSGIQAHQEKMCGPLSGQSGRGLSPAWDPEDIFFQHQTPANSCRIHVSESQRHEKQSLLLCSLKRTPFVRESGCIVRYTFWGVLCQPEL